MYMVIGQISIYEQGKNRRKCTLKEQKNIAEKISNQRKNTATIAILLALTFIITGTFAWYSISQRALSVGELTLNLGGRLHDDFYLQDILPEKSNVANKDVYAENFGENNLIVRIKLSEYLEIDGNIITGGTKEDKSTWVPYVLGNTEGARNVVEWKMGGDKIFLPTFNTDQDSLETDAKGDAIDEITQTATGIGDGTHNYFAPAGTHFERDGTIVAQQTQTSHTTKSTLIQDKEVMSMEEWLTLANIDKIGNFWVVDADGWAYWANLLPPGEATSLLLDEITINRANMSETIYYAVDAIGEFATTNYVDRFYNGESAHGDASENGQELIDTILGLNFRLAVPNDITLDKGESQALAGTVIRTTASGQESEVTGATIEYSISGQSTVNENGVVTIAKNESEATLLLEITAPEYDLTETVTITVPMIPRTPGQRFEDENGVEWRVLVPDDGNGNALIITQYVYNANINYNSSNQWTLFENSYLRNDSTNGMAAWYNNTVGNDIKELALNYAYPEGGNGVEWDAPLNLAETEFNERVNAVIDEKAITLPGSPVTGGDVPIFALSASEANYYGEIGALNKSAQETAGGYAFNWWLRTPGRTANNNVGLRMRAVGDIQSNAAFGSSAIIGFRGALWVQTDTQ